MTAYKNDSLSKSFEFIKTQFEVVDSRLSELKKSEKPMAKLLYQELLEDFTEYVELFNSNIADLISGYEYRIDILKKEDEQCS